MSFHYSAFGLLVQSNVLIPALKPTFAAAGSLPDLVLHLGASPGCSNSAVTTLRYTSSYVDELGQPFLRVWEIDGGSYSRLSFSDGTVFWIDSSARTLWCQWPEALSLENALSYLAGPVFGLLLRMRGVVCVHASAVAINGKSVVFVGPEGAGKSTTAAAFAVAGYAILSDDIVALERSGDEFSCQPAFACLYLWPESEQLLYGSEHALPLILPDWNKKYLPLVSSADEDGPRLESKALPIGAIYVLQDLADRANESTRELDVAEASKLKNLFAGVTPKDALLIVVANSYAAKFLDTDQRAAEFAFLSELVARIPVRQISSSRRTIGLKRLCALVCSDFESLQSAT